MLLVDSGVLLAAADDSDPDHLACVDLLAGTSDELVTTAFVVAEVAYLIDRQLGPAAEAAFFRSLSHGDVRIEPLSAADLSRVSELIERYADFPLGGTTQASSASPSDSVSVGSPRSTTGTSRRCAPPT